MKIKIILAMMSLIAFSIMVNASTVDEDKEVYDREIASDTQSEKKVLKIHQAEQKAEFILALKRQIALQSKEKILEEHTNNKFIDNKNGTVTFKTNGLMWQKCSIGQRWEGEVCSGKATRMDWNTARQLSVNFAGYNDWRLPTREELMTLVFCSDDGYDVNDGSCTNIESIKRPTVNLNYFPNTELGSY